jgi:anti-anti-sigma factor
VTGPATLESEDRGGISVIRIRGEVDISNAEAISTAIEAATSRTNRELVVDLGETTYLDSAGVALLFRLAERLRARRQQIRLVVPPDAPVRSVLELTGLTRIASLEDSVTDTSGKRI